MPWARGEGVLHVCRALVAHGLSRPSRAHLAEQLDAYTRQHPENALVHKFADHVRNARGPSETWWAPIANAAHAARGRLYDAASNLGTIDTVKALGIGYLAANAMKTGLLAHVAAGALMAGVAFRFADTNLALVAFHELMVANMLSGAIRELVVPQYVHAYFTPHAEAMGLVLVRSEESGVARRHTFFIYAHGGTGVTALATPDQPGH